MVNKRRVTPFGPLDAAEVAARLPVQRVPTVTHIGTLDEGQKGSFSLEGPALSVSVHPDAWRKIARLGGHPAHELAGGTFLHATALTGPQWDSVRAWGVQQGHITRGQGFQTRHWDENGEEFFVTHGSREDAKYEADDPDDYLKPVLTSTPTHEEARGMPGDDYALLKLSQAAGKAGLWWSEDLDPDALSAPRGALNK